MMPPQLVPEGLIDQLQSLDEMDADLWRDWEVEEDE